MSGDRATAGPRISIVIAVRNGAATLERCLHSVLEQSHAERELLVLDGGSTDGTQEILRRAGGGVDYWESRPDRGICHAWNKALERCTGEWLCFLGADDRWWTPDALARMAPALRAAGGSPAVVYARVHVLDRSGTILATVGRPWSEARAEFCHRMSIPHQGTFHHRSLFERHGRFDESFRICGDYELLLRELARGEALFVPGLVVTGMGAGGISQGPHAGLAMTREFERARRMHGLTRVPRWLSARLFRANCRAWITRTMGGGAADALAELYRGLAGKPRP